MDADTASDTLLTLYGGYRFEYDDRNQHYGAVDVRPGAIIVGDSSNVVFTVEDLTLDQALWDIYLESWGGCSGPETCVSASTVTLNADSVTMTDSNVTGRESSDWVWSVTGDVDLTSTALNAETVALTVGGSFGQTGGLPRGLDSLTIDGAGVVDFASGAAAESLILTVTIPGDLTVDASSTLRGDGMNSTVGGGAGGNDTSWSGGGYGGYGGYGGNGYSSGPGACFGSASLPQRPGGYGGRGYQTWGGAGGGELSLTVGGTFTLQGVVSSDGDDGEAGDGSGSGGGAGGAVLIKAKAFTGGGAIRADGGDGGDNVGNGYRGCGGGGAGGRVLIRAESLPGIFGQIATTSVEGGQGGQMTGTPDPSYVNRVGQGGGRGTMAFIQLDPATADYTSYADQAADSHLHTYTGWRWESGDPRTYDAVT